MFPQMLQCQTSPYFGESRSLVVKAEDSQLSVCEFKPRRHTLDGVSEASYYKLQWKKKYR